VILTGRRNGTAKAGEPGFAGRATLDSLLRRAADIRPESAALADAPNRATLVGGEPRRFDWATLDRTVDVLAKRLQTLGFPVDSVIATQFSLSTDAVVSLLAITRAGMIAAPLPLGWGRREIVSHLQRIGARGILTCGRAGPVECADSMRFAAAETFSVRFVMSIGGTPLDGVVPLDDVFDAIDEAERIEIARTGNPADHIALVTADAAPAGYHAVCRSHNEIIAGGLGAFMAGVPDEASAIAASLAPDSFAGIALQLVPWLMCGGRLVLHPPFAPRVFADDLGPSGITHAVLPAAAAAVILRPAPEARPVLRHLSLLARRGDDAALAVAIHPEGVAVDCFLGLGEAALTRLVPGAAGAGIPLGPDTFATGAGQAPVLVETRVTAAGTMAVRGAMVPMAAFPPGAERDMPPVWSIDAEGFHDTGVPVTVDKAARMLAIAGRPEGLVTIGGRRLADSDIRQAYQEAGGEIAPVIREDAVLGQRVSGVIGDGRAAIGLAERLEEAGLSPLGVPGAARHGIRMPFEDTRPKEPVVARDALADTQATLEQLLTMARSTIAR
jgi:non-ribosomal peptide synthetase component E (peptide arylation enzyme)